MVNFYCCKLFNKKFFEKIVQFVSSFLSRIALLATLTSFLTNCHITIVLIDSNINDKFMSTDVTSEYSKPDTLDEIVAKNNSWKESNGVCENHFKIGSISFNSERFDKKRQSYWTE